MNDLLNKLEELNWQAECLEDNGLNIAQNNSYADSSTGYNYVDDIEFTEKYEALLDEIEICEKFLNQLHYV